LAYQLLRSVDRKIKTILNVVAVIVAAGIWGISYPKNFKV